MLGSSRISMQQLAILCRRLATSLSAGIDVRTVFLREAESAHGAARARMNEIHAEVSTGTSIHEAFAATGKYFPKFFRSLVKVGEESGQLPEVFRRLADHYDNKIRLRRVMMISLSWPIAELVLALGVIGIVIWIMGVVPELKKNNVDILGFGLVGNRGLLIYLGFLAAIAAVLYAIYWAAVRGLVWVAPIQIAIMKLPGLGGALEVMAMANLAWAMQVTLNTGMDIGKAMELSLASTRNALYTRHTKQIVKSLRGGNEVHEALRDTGSFPHMFTDAVQAGEESGQLVETMAHMAGQYQDQARSAGNTLTTVMTFVISGVFMSVIVFMIFRIAGSYVNTINDVLKMK